MHRRENADHVESIANSIISMMQSFPDVSHEIISHPNETTTQLIEQLEQNEHYPELLQPLSYSEMITKLNSCQLVVTDSGGILEECTYLKTPTIIFRKTTERQEGLAQDWIAICDPENPDLISIAKSLAKKSSISHNQSRCTVYGDGSSSAQITSHLEQLLRIS